MDLCKSIGLCVGGTLIKLEPFKLNHSIVLLADLSEYCFPSDGASLRVYMRNSEEYRICNFSCGQQKISLVGKDIIFSGFYRGGEVKDFKVNVKSNSLREETNNVICIAIHKALDTRFTNRCRCVADCVDGVGGGSLVCYDTDKPSDLKYSSTNRFLEGELLAHAYIILYKPSDDNVRYFH
jgi:hypothetical protein